MKNKKSASGKKAVSEMTIAPVVAGWIQARKKGLIQPDPAADPTTPFEAIMATMGESERRVVGRIDRFVTKVTTA